MVVLYVLICVFILSSTATGCVYNKSVEDEIELKAYCNDSGVEAQISLQWNPASLSKQSYVDSTLFGGYPNLNLEYHCYNSSDSSTDQVNTHVDLHLHVVSTKDIEIDAQMFKWLELPKD